MGRISSFEKFKQLLLFCCFMLAVCSAKRSLAQTPPNCATLLDLTVVLDMSGSVGIDNWEQVMVPFVKEFVSKLEVSEKGVHTALLQYSNQFQTQWKLDNAAYYDKTALLNAIEKMKKKYYGGTTLTGEALTRAKDELVFGPGSRSEAPKLLVILTDGSSNDEIEKPSLALKKSGVTVIAVGVANADEKQCKVIAGCGPLETCSRYKMANWSSLMGEVNGIIKTACESMPKDAVCSDWENWSTCSNTCGNGTQNRKRKSPITIAEQQPGTNGKNGRTCEEQGVEEKETRLCNEKECAVDAICGSFGGWTCCSKSCGGGKKERTRAVWNNPPAKFGGKTCEDQGLVEKEEEDCNPNPCPIDAVPGEWNDWTECSATCGWGFRTRDRKPEEVKAAHGGHSIEQQGLTRTEEEMCQNFPCGPCHSHWAPWTGCSTKCGPGLKTRHRIVRFDYPDHMCAAELYDTYPCNSGNCEVPTEIPVAPEEPVGGGANTAAIAGGIVGGLALLGAAGGAYTYYRPGGGAGSGGPESVSFDQGTGDAEVEVPENEESVPVDADSEFWVAEAE